MFFRTLINKNPILTTIRMSSTTTLTKPKVLRFGPIRYAQEAWKEFGNQVEVVESSATNREEFIEELKNGKWDDVSCITRTFESVNITGKFDEELVSYLPKNIKAICHNGAGYDQISIPPCDSKDIQVSNVPSLVDNATADTHIYLLLGAMRNFQISHNNLMAGKWEDGTKCAGTSVGHDPEGKTVGIFGMGGIGRAVRDRLKPFGFKKIIYHNRRRLDPSLEGGAEYVSFDELISQSDIISINIPLNPSTKHSINSKSIEKMKDGVVIINTARGAIIDEEALIKGLKNGKIGSCGLDVFEHEPHVPRELLELPNCVSVPHMGTHTVETIKSMEEFVVLNAKTFIETGKVKAMVPELQEKYKL